MSPRTLADTGINIRQALLNEVWSEVYALGGYASPDDAEAVAYNDAIGEALIVIARLRDAQATAFLPTLPHSHQHEVA